ncbi:MAG: hypothetical protein JRJ27_21765 [Deltaproteobacteria bacterium]|nr:hypothetical protein [Deltaproteobacteria bacterium]
MSIIALILILIPVVLIIASIKSKGKARKILLSILIIIILIPVAFIILIKPAQQGKVLPQWGKLSFLFSEPKDLWNLLAEESLDKDKKEYNFTFTHKYVGNHSVEIIFSNKNIDVGKIDKNDIRLTVAFYEGTTLLFSKTTSYIGGFIGPRGKGLTYIRYSLPEDLPVHKKLNAKIEITGDIEEFINKHGSAKILIKKGSDL